MNAKLKLLQSAARSAPKLLAQGIADVICERDRLLADNKALREALELCYDHCRLYHSEVEHNNVGEAVRTALAQARHD